MRITPLLVLAMLGACGEPPVGVTLQQSRALRIGQGGFLALDLLATQGDLPIACGQGTFDVTVSVTAEGVDGHFTMLPPQSYVVACDDGRTGDLALVVDNSGSEDGFLERLQEAAKNMAHEVLARGGRLSLVRVSTNARVVQPLSADVETVDAAIDGLEIANGWTALWDGVRMGLETLGGAVAPDGTRTAIQDFCFGERPLGVAAFTDGVDNNSADEQAVSYNVGAYPGDGVATSLSDLMQEGAASTTPVYTIGLGDDVDHVALGDLALSTGARYRPIAVDEEIPEAFDVLQRYFDATHEVCVELPELECGELVVQVDWSWDPGDGSPAVTGTAQQDVSYPCPVTVQRKGRVATMLVTLGDPGISEELAGSLALQAVEWASPRLRPRVLIVLDDGHNGEDVTDHELVQWLLADVDTLEVTYLDEPVDGLIAEDIEGYDVVWFANPGYPWDDVSSRDVLQDFVDAGGGLVLQGDDMTWSKNKAFDLTELTGLQHVDNGTQACGQNIDNRRGSTYTVTIGSVDHAITRGHAGTSFVYGNDIDNSTIVGPSLQVLATAVPTAAPSCAPRAVIVGYAPGG